MRPQPCINPVSRAFAGGGAPHPQQPLGQLHEVFTIADLPARTSRGGSSLIRKQEDEVDIRRVIQVARPEFAERHHAEFSSADAALLMRCLRRTVMVVQILTAQ